MAKGFRSGGLDGSFLIGLMDLNNRKCLECGQPILSEQAKVFCSTLCRNRANGRKAIKDPADFWAKVQKLPNGCWLWLGNRNKRCGYFKRGPAHRYAYHLVLVQIFLNVCCCRVNDFPELQAAKTAAQISGAVVAFPVSRLRLNCCFLIFSANSMPGIVTAAVSNRLNPSIGRKRCFIRR